MMQSPRRKSCNQCRQSKTKCSLDQPQCTRCQKRRFHCVYEERRQPIQSLRNSPNPYSSWVLPTKSPFPVMDNSSLLSQTNGDVSLANPFILNTPEHTPENSIRAHQASSNCSNHAEKLIALPRLMTEPWSEDDIVIDENDTPWPEYTFGIPMGVDVSLSSHPHPFRADLYLTNNPQ